MLIQVSQFGCLEYLKRNLFVPIREIKQCREDKAFDILYEDKDKLKLPALSTAGLCVPFISFAVSTGVPKVEVGAGIVGAGEVRCALYASLCWLPPLLAPHFKRVRCFSFSIGVRRSSYFFRRIFPWNTTPDDLGSPFLV